MDFLFDIGNVLLHVDFRTSLAKVLPGSREDPDEVLATLMTHKDDLETGRVSPAQFITDAIRTLDYRGPREEFVAAWCDVFEPVDAMWRTVDSLAAAGHRLILFSNTNQLHMDDALRRYPVFRHFHEAVFSHLVGAMKPDEAIYRHAIDRHRLDPAATIYVDDLPENVATGRRLGFRSWQYDAGDHPSFLGWLGQQLDPGRA